MNADRVTKVYVFMVEDRHIDPDCEVFTTAEAAIAYARQQAKSWSDPEDYEESEIDGWLFYARYSVESDGVWVVEKELRT